MTMTVDIRSIMGRGPVIPVVTIDNPTTAPDLARALLVSGISVIELTLRTPGALEAARLIAEQVEEMVVGVGTVLDPSQAVQAAEVGAVFAVSPGFDPDLLTAVSAAGLAYLPGVQTASEVMAARKAGLRALKFFPAASSGGADALKQLQPVFPDIAFCPTGGISLQDAPAYLALENVLCIGGSFAAPARFIQTRDWMAVTESARQACALRG
jgi:2-dehydro-3-deoxyphosphogluconate aldolase / (4S)-4-hydroxy-2-oxoglutarate aldolase